MEFQRNPHLKLTIVLVVMLSCVHSQLTGTDCNGKTFYCLDDQQFQVCKSLSPGKSQTVDDIAHPCPTDSFCYNAGKLECDSQTRLTTTTSCGSGQTFDPIKGLCSELPGQEGVKEQVKRKAFPGRGGYNK